MLQEQGTRLIRLVLLSTRSWELPSGVGGGAGEQGPEGAGPGRV